MPKKILIIHGPNLNLLGKREPEIYGNDTLEDINDRIREFAQSKNCSVEIVQSNSEGAIIDSIQSAMGQVSGIIINPGAYAHYSLAIYDAIKGSSLPAVEVHLTNIFSRDEFRRQSVIAPACRGLICGLGWRGYIAALESILNIADESNS